LALQYSFLKIYDWNDLGVNSDSIQPQMGEGCTQMGLQTV
jgi:hypothetical protein